MRPWILRLHRWSTFVLGAFFVLVCVTGSVLVFGDEIDRLARPGLFAATPGDVGPDSALAAVRAAVPGRDMRALWFPRHEQPVYTAELAGGAARYVHVDPGTGRVLGARGEPVINTIRQLHVNLLSGTTGAQLVGWLGVALLLMIASGIWLWWPGLRKLAIGFRFRRRGGAALINYDLHNLTGIVSAPLLALITLTGVAIIFGSATRVVLHALWLRSPEPIVRIENTRLAPSESANPLPVAEFVRRAQDTIPGYDMMAVFFPPRPGAPLQVRMSEPGVRYRDGLVRVLLDPSSGAVVGTLDMRTMAPPDAFRRRWMVSLHAGEFGGVPMRVVYVIVGLIPVGLIVTGLVVWWLRRQGRLALAERRAAQAA